MGQMGRDAETCNRDIRGARFESSGGNRVACKEIVIASLIMQEAVAMEKLIEQIKKHEGFRNYVYLDSLGYPTCGYGHHLYVGSPITETIAQAQQLVALAEKRELVLQVGHIERFNPAYIELKHVAEDLDLIGVSMRRLSPFDTSNVDVDVIRDLMIHDLDLAVDLVGAELSGIVAWGRSIHTGAIDHAVTTLSFRGGPIATLFASRVTEQKVRAVEVIADGAYIEADLLNKTVMVHRRTFPQYLDNHHTTKYRQESVLPRLRPLPDGGPQGRVGRRLDGLQDLSG